MPTLKQLGSACLFTFALLTTAAAQESNPPQRSTLTITASASGERVRITAPSSVVQMHLEVYASGGEKLFDQELRGGNVFDWHLQNGQGQRLPVGTYVCVVTAKSISGKLTQKIGRVMVAETSDSVQPGDSRQLSVQQSQVIGPIEENASWTILGDGENQTTTVIAHNGTDGQMIRGRGALSFRIGDFFNRKDTEQMRLTEVGNLGIGTDNPQSRLDVAGTIRAQRFLVVKPKTGDSQSQTQAVESDAADSVQPLVSGTGTAGRLTKWTDGIGTLGDSIVTEAGTNIGIGTTTPGYKLDILGTTAAQFHLGINADNGAYVMGLDGAAYWSAGSAFNGSSWIAKNASQATFEMSGGAYNFFSNTGLIPGNSFIQTSRLAIDSSGKVGISTPGPLEKLDVRSSFARTSTTARNIAFFGSNDAANPLGLVIGHSFNSSRSHVSLVGTIYGSNGSDIDINRDEGGTGGMTIQYQGNIGIGTSTPAAKLDVLGNINTSTQYNIGGNRVLSNLGVNNLFAGVGAGNSNTSGNSNTFVGREAGFNNMAGSNNSFFGRAAGVLNASGGNNSFMGFFAGLQNTGGSNNSFMGTGAGLSNTDGYENAFFGTFAGQANTGNSNTFIGAFAGQANTTGSSNTIIGANANVGAPSLINATAIGAGAVVNNSNSTVISGDTTVLSGVNINVPNNLKVGVLHLQSGTGTNAGSVCYGNPIDGYITIGQCVSSRRYKTNIARLGSGLDLVRRLRPITFDWKEGGKHDLGLIAEDVAAIEPLLATYDSKGQVEGVKYDRVGVLLVNAVQEQQAQIARQQERLERQEEQISGYQKLARQQQAILAAQQQQLAGLKKIVCRSHRRCV